MNKQYQGMSQAERIDATYCAPCKYVAQNIWGGVAICVDSEAEAAFWSSLNIYNVWENGYGLRVDYRNPKTGKLGLI